MCVCVCVCIINIVGGFILTSRMLQMFKRPGDPPGYEAYYAAPMAALVGGYFVTKGMGVDTINMAYVASGVLCIGSVCVCVCVCVCVYYIYVYYIYMHMCICIYI